jgi:hypothetical protein
MSEPCTRCSTLLDSPNQAHFCDPDLAKPYRGQAPHNGTSTCKEAAKSMGDHLGPLEAAVVDWIKAHGPSTRFEIGEGTNMRPQTCTARVRTLVLRGVLVDLEETRPTDSGRPARVVALVEAQPRQLEMWEGGKL